LIRDRNNASEQDEGQRYKDRIKKQQKRRDAPPLLFGV
jgi:hypothetical protein